MRTSFGGGILGKGMQLRVDMDVYARGLSDAQNLELGQLGYARRRKGMAHFAPASNSTDKLFAYVYSPSINLLIHISSSFLNIYNMDGDTLATIASPPWTAEELATLKASQLKKALILTHTNHHPQELSPTDSSLESWTLSDYSLSHEPWYTLELQDTELALTIDSDLTGSVSFEEAQSDIQEGDMLRASYTVDSESYDIDDADGYYPNTEGVLCGGTWTLQVSGERGITLRVQRKYIGGDWHNRGTSISDLDSPTNNILTGDETDAPCYLRVFATDYTERNSDNEEWDDWDQSLVLDSWTRTLRLQIINKVDTYELQCTPPEDFNDWDFFGQSDEPLYFIMIGDTGEPVYITLKSYTEDSFIFNLPEDATYIDPTTELVIWRQSGTSPDTIPISFIYIGSSFLVGTQNKEISYIFPRPEDDKTWTITHEDATYSLLVNGTRYTPTLSKASFQTLSLYLSDLETQLSEDDEVQLILHQPTSAVNSYARYYPAGTIFNASSIGNVSWVPIYCLTLYKQEGTTWVSASNSSVSHTIEEGGWYYLAIGTATPPDDDDGSCTLYDGPLSGLLSTARDYSFDASLNEITDGLTGLSTTTIDWSWCAWAYQYGYPSTSFIHQQRVSFASTSAQPQTFWMSKTDDIDNYEVLTDYDDSSIAATLDTSNESCICWVATKGTDLCMGTQLGEYVVAAGDNTTSLTAANALAYPDGYVGASNAASSVVAADLIIYLERGSQRIRSIGYSDAANGYISTDITILCPEIIENGGSCVSLTYLRKPDPILYAVRADGQMACCAFNPQQNVCAWYRYTSPNAAILQCLAMPQLTGGDWLFLLVQRTSPDGGSTSIGIEVIRDTNDYTDPCLNNDGTTSTQDYESLLLTTDLSYMETLSKESLNSSLNFLIAEECPAQNVTVTVDGGTKWVNINQQNTLKEGWNKVNAIPSNKDRRIFGFKVTGNRDFWCLGMATIKN